ncbi:hypothetical protein BJV78DRAFT_898451 [Lactifluus subvellereus]|nr:hypothetical protein BJV78DRAFT_898451 [Lactifluus subvellereus]
MGQLGYPSFLGQQLPDNELEVVRGLNRQLRSEMGYRDGARPVSGVSALSAVSARSRNTIFYDAPSCEDVSSTSPPVSPLPQGTASTGRNGYNEPSPLAQCPQTQYTPLMKVKDLRRTSLPHQILETRVMQLTIWTCPSHLPRHRLHHHPQRGDCRLHRPRFAFTA